jgi:nitrogen-specific signal transduction histidine kinase
MVELRISLININAICRRCNSIITMNNAQSVSLTGIEEALRSILHDLNNSMAGLQGQAQLLKVKYAGNPDLAGISDRIVESTMAATRLVNDLNLLRENIENSCRALRKKGSPPDRDT